MLVNNQIISRPFKEQSLALRPSASLHSHYARSKKCAPHNTPSLNYLLVARCEAFEEEMYFLITFQAIGPGGQQTVDAMPRAENAAIDDAAIFHH